MSTKNDLGIIASREAERAVLGGILLDNSALQRAAEALDPQDFSLDSHRRIFARMLDLKESASPIDLVTLSEELRRHEEVGVVGGHAYVSSLTEGLPNRPNTVHYIRIVKEKALLRRAVDNADAIRDVAFAPCVGIEQVVSHFTEAAQGLLQEAASGTSVRRFEEIPDIFAMHIQPIEYIVDGLIAAKTLTLWAGVDGSAKTFLVQNMALAVATGSEFLRRKCEQRDLLYLDYENPDFAVQERVRLMASGPTAAFKVWGTWLQPPPPSIGSERLLQIAKDARPLIVIDPFRYAHSAEENDSTEMMEVMRALRSCAAVGAAVIVVHHTAKAEGSTGRGSTAIRGAMDVAFLQELSDRTGLITLSCVKNRFAGKLVLTIRPNFATGRFELVDSGTAPKPKRDRDLDKLAQVIADHPGSTQNEIVRKAQIKRTRAAELLQEHAGKLWQVSNDGKAYKYYLLVPVVQEPVGTSSS